MTPLFLNHDADYDWLIALELGRVDDGLPDAAYEPLSTAFAYAHDVEADRPIGFIVHGFSDFDPEALEVWGEPRFDAPVLGLRDAAAGEIVLAARAFFDGEDSLNRWYFSAAVEAEGDEAVDLWRSCLQAGDAMAHYGLGYTLYDLGRFTEAYPHLRHYTEIAPALPWTWYWFGKAAAAVGETAEARAAFGRVLVLDEDDRTDARERLEALG